MKGCYEMKNGKTMKFNRQGFACALAKKAKENGISQQELMENVSEQIGVSYSAMKHWRQGHNAPSDLEKVSDIAAALNIDRKNLLIETEDEEMTMNQNTSASNTTIINMPEFSSEKEAIRSIYCRMVDFIERFRNIDCLHKEQAKNYMEIYNRLMHVRLDIPVGVFTDLRSFTIDFLQQMVVAAALFEKCSDMEDEAGFYEYVQETINAEGTIFDYSIDPLNWIDHELVHRPDFNSEDTKAACRSIVEDWNMFDDFDPFVPVYLFENTINCAYERLMAILASYQTA